VPQQRLHNFTCSLGACAGRHQPRAGAAATVDLEMDGPHPHRRSPVLCTIFTEGCDGRHTFLGGRPCCGSGRWSSFDFLKRQRDEALRPLDLRPQLAKHAAELLRYGMQFVPSQLAGAGNVALDDVLGMDAHPSWRCGILGRSRVAGQITQEVRSAFDHP
jgi:hypothetical protein